MTRVFKFGGALMMDAGGVRRIASIIRPYLNEPLFVVVSAMGKTTNTLEELLQFALNKKEKELRHSLYQLKQQHEQITEQLSPGNSCQHKLSALFEELETELHNRMDNPYAAYDRVISFGERFSGLILHEFFISEGLPCVHTDARKMIVTDSNYTSAKIQWEKTEKLVRNLTVPVFAEGKFMLTEGFIGADASGNPTTLGREGSDFTAAILAYVLDSREVTIWKDVPGLMNADPNRFHDCIKLDSLSYHEAIELTFYGASVIHPKTIQPLQKKNIPLLIRSFYQPDNSPSVISGDYSSDTKIPKIIVKDDQVLLSIQSKDLSFIAEENLTTIFDAFSRFKIHINLMQHSAVSFSVCFDNHQSKLETLLPDLSTGFRVKYNKGLQLITVRHYTDDIIQKLLAGKHVFLEQKSRSTFQVLIR